MAAAAVDLADRYGADREKARIAGLVHDCARDLPRNILLKRVLEFGIVLDEIEEQETGLLHGPVGAHLASCIFGITDKDVFTSVYYHTTGRARMSLLEKIVYLADYVEPGRHFPGVEELRVWAQRDLNVAILRATDSTLKYVIERGGLIHPRTVEARNWLLCHEMGGYAPKVNQLSP